MKRFTLVLMSWCGLVASAVAQSASDPNEGSVLTRNATSGTFTFSWWGLAGRTYFIQQSEDLLTWHYFPVIESGAGQPMEWGFATMSAKLFLRLRTSDIATGDPLAADFDGDGMNNDWELRSGLDPLATNVPNANPDGDDATDLQEAIANTSPTDPAPVLTLSSPAGAALVP